MSQILSTAELRTIKNASNVLRAINHPLRLVILEKIKENPEITVTQLYVMLRLEQSVCSQHLAILRKAGFLECHRIGKFIKYTIVQYYIDIVLDLSNKFNTLKNDSL